jgi:hypothetical protein
MTLFERVLAYVKSAGVAIESEEHKLLNEFAAYLGSEKVVSGFSDSPVVKDFASMIAPQPVTEQESTPVVEEPVAPAPAAVVDAVVSETTPVSIEPIEEVSAESTISVSE